jgi:hypothetical protein
MIGEYHLTITDVELRDEGRFHCQLSGAKGKPVISAKAELTVLVSPHTVSVYPTNSTHMLANSAAEFKCTALSSKPAANISWIVGHSVQVIRTELEQIANDKLITTSSTIQIIPVVEDRGKIIYCKVDGESLRKPMLVAVSPNIVCTRDQ